MKNKHEPEPRNSKEKKGKKAGNKPVLLAAGIALLALAIAYVLTVILPAMTPAPTPTPTPPITTPSTELTTVRLVKLVDDSCGNCFNVEEMAKAVKRTGVQVSAEKTVSYDSEEGQKLVADNRIEGVPTLVAVVESGFEKIPEPFTKLMDNRGGGVYVFHRLIPVYVNVSTRETIGAITATFLNDPDCLKCVNLSREGLPPDYLQALGITISIKLSVDYNSDPGKELVRKYNITKVPTLLYSKDFAAYPNLRKQLLEIGTQESDGTFVLRTYNPPYRNLETGNVEGYVKFIYLVDEACEECYAPEIHRTILKKYNADPVSETVYDIGSKVGKEYVEKYNVTKVPTLLISPEIALYPSMQTILGQAYSKEPDGWYVFTNFQTLPTANYKDLQSGQVVIQNKSVTKEITVPV